MNRFRCQSIQFVVLLLAIIAYCRPAQAYVDLGTGSYIVQVSIAAVAGALFSVKMIWTRFRNRLGRSRSNDTKSSSKLDDAR